MNEQPDERVAWVRSAMDRHAGPLTRYAAQLLGDADRARDVVQDTFVRLCGQEPAGLDGRLVEWLYTVCRNRALDVRKKETRMTPLTEAHVDACLAGEASPDCVAEGRDSAARVLVMLATLPDQQREALRLRFQNGLSYREIAAVTQWSVNHVGVVIHNGLKALRERLAEGP